MKEVNKEFNSFAAQYLCPPTYRIKHGQETPYYTVLPEVDKVFKCDLYSHTFLSKKETPSVELKSCVGGSVVPTKCVQKQDSRYEVEFTPRVRGRHQLAVCVNNIPVVGSPFPVFVKISPTQLGTPVRIIKEEVPSWVTFDSQGKLVLSSYSKGTVIFEKNGTKVNSFQPLGNSRIGLYGVTIDVRNNIYVVDDSNHCLYKFDKDGNQVGKFGSKGSKRCEFSYPRGVSVVNDRVFVCDRDNDRIQVFTTELKFVKEIGSYGTGNGQFNEVWDISFDEHGNAYVCDRGNNRIQVFDKDWNFLYSFSLKGCDQLSGPASLCLCGQFVYVVEFDGICVSVFSKNGQFIASFGQEGSEPSQFDNPLGIACDRDGFVYVCDTYNGRVQVF